MTKEFQNGPPSDAKPGDRWGAYELSEGGWWAIAPEKLLAKGTHLDSAQAKAALIYVALESDLWPRLSMDDRQRWCERGEIADTEGGRLFFNYLKRMQFL